MERKMQKKGVLDPIFIALLVLFILLLVLLIKTLTGGY